ncbi:MAG: hypothetical protein P8M04_07665 [Akkermansiaceae bacterium]|nr:hypothetical protein [Akkermansiaceae bacterium]
MDRTGDAIVSAVVFAQVPHDRDRRDCGQLIGCPASDRPVLTTIARAVRVGRLL